MATARSRIDYKYVYHTYKTVVLINDSILADNQTGIKLSGIFTKPNKRFAI